MNPPSEGTNLVYYICTPKFSSTHSTNKKRRYIYIYILREINQNIRIFVKSILDYKQNWILLAKFVVQVHHNQPSPYLRMLMHYLFPLVPWGGTFPYMAVIVILPHHKHDKISPDGEMHMIWLLVWWVARLLP